MTAPLAERLRPRTLDDYIGQTHLVGKDCILRRMIDSGNVSSFILWGPPGVGKTTLARIIANTTKSAFYTLSAVHSGVKEVRDVLDQCKADARSMFSQGRPILFIDEIHRFNKSQQDSLLGAVESGIVTLVGATTENPSFEVLRKLSFLIKSQIILPIFARIVLLEFLDVGLDLLKFLDQFIDTGTGFKSLFELIHDSGTIVEDLLHDDYSFLCQIVSHIHIPSGSSKHISMIIELYANFKYV